MSLAFMQLLIDIIEFALRILLILSNDPIQDTFTDYLHSTIVI